MQTAAYYDKPAFRFLFTAYVVIGFALIAFGFFANHELYELVISETVHDGQSKVWFLGDGLLAEYFPILSTIFGTIIVTLGWKHMRAAR